MPRLVVVSLICLAISVGIAASLIQKALAATPPMTAKIIDRQGRCTPRSGKFWIKVSGLTPGKPLSWKQWYPSGKPYPELPQGNYMKADSQGNALLVILCGTLATGTSADPSGVYRFVFFDLYTNPDERSNERSVQLKFRVYPAA